MNLTLLLKHALLLLQLQLSKIEKVRKLHVGREDA